MYFRFLISASVACLMVIVAINVALYVFERTGDAAPPADFPLVVEGGAEGATARLRRDVGALRDFLSISPTVRLEQALDRSDTRYLGVSGATLEVPGVAATPAIPASRVQPIPGIQRTAISGDHDRLVDRARRYALLYNELLVERLSEPDASSASAAASPERTAPSSEGATR